MYLEAKKVRLIQKLLRVKDGAVLDEVETVLKPKKKTQTFDKDVFSKFVGIWTEDEADEIANIIERSCETIHPDDWK